MRCRRRYLPGCPSEASRSDEPAFLTLMKTAGRKTAQSIFLCVALSVFWIACVATFHVHEMLVGAGAVTLALGFSIFVVRTLPLHFRPTLRDLLQLWRLPGYMVIDVVQVTLVLVQDLLGKPAPSLFRATQWDPVGEDGRSVAKRALAIAGTTISPNFIVIGIDCESRRMLFHQLKDTPVPRMTQQLGAGAGR